MATPRPPPRAIRQRNTDNRSYPTSRPTGKFTTRPPLRRRSFFQRYLLELFVFALTLTGSLLYMYLNLDVEHEDLAAHLPTRKRFRVWDWPPLHEMENVKDQWHLAVVSLVLPTEVPPTQQGGRPTARPVHEDVTFQSSLGAEHNIGPSDNGHLTMPPFFLDHDVYGVLAWHPSDHSIPNITQYNKQAHLDLFQDMTEAQPDAMYEMDVENRQRGLELGWAATYSNMRTRQERDEIEAQMLLLGRMYGQVAIYKWWAHQYGPDPQKDVSIIQDILPTAAATWNLRTSGPVYRVR